MKPLALLVLSFTLVIPGYCYGFNLREFAKNLLKDVGIIPSINVECLTLHCLPELGRCGLVKECRSAMACSVECFGLWEKDNTSEKYHVQNCTNICAFTYRVKEYESSMKCVSDHKCISFPPIPSQCVAPQNLTILKKLSVQDLKGSWWVMGGYHPVYDCYPCQHLTFSQINATAWTYLPKYQVYLENGSLALVDDSYIIPNTTPGENISFVYHDVGLSHYETWWLVDAAEDMSYILLYYCGGTLQWYYDGALILSRNTTLPDTAYTAIAASYAKSAGLDFNKFCKTKVQQCPDNS